MVRVLGEGSKTEPFPVKKFVKNPLEKSLINIQYENIKTSRSN